MVMASVHKEEEKRDGVFYSQPPPQFAGTASGETGSGWPPRPGPAPLGPGGGSEGL